MAVANISLKVNSAQAVTALNKANSSAQKLNNTFNRSQGAIKDTGSSLRGLGKAGFAAANGSKAAVTGITSVGAAIKTALGPVSAIIAGVASLGQAFQVLAQQDFAEAKVRSLGVDSDELTARLSGVSRELAGQASVLDLTSAAYDVASAGFTNAADAANILKAASQGATGGFSDINTVGDAATSVLNAYGLEADKASKLVDGFIQTQNDGKIVIGEYAANIAKVAPVAAALSVPLEEVNAAVAQITAGGQKAEVTFTALKTALAQIAAGKVGKEFKNFGITINSSTLASEGLAGTLQKIKASGADAGTVIKAFGTEAGPSILALLNDTEKFNKLLENQKNAQGAAAKAAFEASDTINGALKRLQTAFTNIFADGSELGLLLKGTFQVAAVTVEFFGAALKSALAPIRGLIAGVQQFFQELAPFGENINLAFELEKAFQSFMKTVSFTTDVVTGLFTVIGRGVATHIGRVLTLANSIREGVVGVFSGLGETIKSTLASLYEALPSPIRFIIEQAAKGFNAVKDFLGSAVSGVAQQVSGAVGELARIGGGVQSNQQQPGAQPPAANAIQPTNGALAGKDKISDEQKLVELSRQKVQALKDQASLASAVNEEEKRRVKLNIDLRKIAENAQGFADADVEAQMNARIELEEKRDAAIAYNKELKEAAKIEDQARKDRKKAEEEARKARENDPLVRMQEELDKLVSKETQALAAATSIGNAFTDAFGDVITGTKSVSEAGADMLKSIAADFLAMAKKIIAQQLIMILYQSILKALGGPGGGGGGDVGNMTGAFDSGVGGIFPTSPSFSYPLAEGGYVSGPTNALIGEGGEPEYVIPESKMRTAMSRYSRGSRGNSVIPESGAAETAEGGGGTVLAAPIDVRYTVERINSVDYVTADQFQTGMQQAAQQGAKQGEQQTLKRLQMSGSTRKRIGI